MITPEQAIARTLSGWYGGTQVKARQGHSRPAEPKLIIIVQTRLVQTFIKISTRLCSGVALQCVGFGHKFRDMDSTVAIEDERVELLCAGGRYGMPPAAARGCYSQGGELAIER